MNLKRKRSVGENVSSSEGMAVSVNSPWDDHGKQGRYEFTNLYRAPMTRQLVSSDKTVRTAREVGAHTSAVKVPVMMYGAHPRDGNCIGGR